MSALWTDDPAAGMARAPSVSIEQIASKVTLCGYNTQKLTESINGPILAPNIGIPQIAWFFF